MSTRFILTRSVLFTCYIWLYYQIVSRLGDSVVFSWPNTCSAQWTLIAAGASGCPLTQIKSPLISGQLLLLYSGTEVNHTQDAGLCWLHTNHGKRNTWSTRPVLTTQWQQNQDTAQASPETNVSQTITRSSLWKEGNSPVKSLWIRCITEL